MNRVLLASLLLAQAATVMAVQPDLLQHQQRAETARQEAKSDEYLRPTIPEAGVTQVEVDTTGIWFHLRYGRLAQARAEFNRLQAANPGWQPDNDLRMALQNRPASTATADPYELEMGRLARMSETQVRALSATRLSTAASQTLARQHGNNALLLGWLHLQRDEPQQALPLFQQAAIWQPDTGAEDGLAETHFRLARQAALQQQPEMALQQAERSREYGRTTAYADLAWLLYEQQHFSAAQTAFEQPPITENSVYGQVLTLQSQQQYEQAEMLACAEQNRSQRIAGICDELSVMLAWMAFEAADYRQAADRFDLLLSAAPENRDYAFALEESLRRLNATARLADARQRHPLLRESVSRLAFDRAWGRKQFDLAQRMMPEPALAGREDWQLTLGLHGRMKKGDKGLTRLTHYQPYVAATRVWNKVRLGVALRMDDLNSGRPPVGADFGTQPDQAPQRRALAGTRSFSPEISARHERDGLTLQGSFFTIQQGEAKNSRAYGQLQGDWYPAPGLVSLTLFRLPLEDSLLARQGARDPASDREWGQVADQGGRLLLAIPVAEKIGVAISGTLASQVGYKVADNDRKALRLDLAHNFADRFTEPELDYLRMGPFVEWMSWDQNLSHFTYGHGGYYSPQQLLRAGLQLELLTAEARNWQVRSRASLSWNRVKEHAADFYPLDAGGARYDANTSRGPGGDLLLEAMRLVNKQLLVGGYLGYAAADDYRDARFGLVVRVPFQSRQSVISADLPMSSIAGH